jgi:UTP--glucose-1-phosphate uridylyltransferase
MAINLAVVPVAGQGTRLLPLTKSQPKEMLPVGSKPVVQYVVEELDKSGIKKIVFITGAGKSSIENHFDIDWELTELLRRSGREEQLAELEFQWKDLEYFYTRQRRPLGLGHAVFCARSLVGDQPFVIALGDSIIGLRADSDIVKRLIEVYERGVADVVVALEEVSPEEVSLSGIVQIKGSDNDVCEIARLVEKPKKAEAPSNLAIAGRYVCSPKLFAALKKISPVKDEPIELTAAIEKLIEEGSRVLGVKLRPGERRFDIGAFDTYFRAFVEFALADPRYGEALRSYLETLLTKTETTG